MERRLHAVLTVDFDVNELSRSLRAGELADMRTLLFTNDGTLLAYSQVEKRIAELPLSMRRWVTSSMGAPTCTRWAASATGCSPVIWCSKKTPP